MGIGMSQVQRHTSLESSYIPVALRREILRLGDYVCAFCHKREKHKVCHDIPKARGGKTELSNLLVCCQVCQKAKDCRTAAEFKEQVAWQGRTQNTQAETLKQSIPIEIHFLDGEVLIGITNSFPGKQTLNIWISPRGNGEKVFVSLGSVKKIVFKSGKIKDLHSLTSTSTSAKVGS